MVRNALHFHAHFGTDHFMLSTVIMVTDG